MARRFFNERIKKKRQPIDPKLLAIIGGCAAILIIILVVVIISLNTKAKLKNATIEVWDVITVEVNGKLPENKEFFKELKNVKEKDIKISYKKDAIEKVGEYDVTIKIYGKTFDSKLEVVDTVSPVLEVKDVKIENGVKYKATDFVKSCTDNSKKECKIEFYTLGLSEDGKKIDYSSYTKEGNYTIQIVASDESGNITKPLTAKLTIGAPKEEPPKPKVCQFGSNEYDKTEYNLSVDITNDGCAIDYELYEDEKTIKPAKRLIKTDEKKLKKEFSKINLKTDNVYVNSTINGVLNKEQKGIVGYTIYVEVTINRNNKKQVIESYYLKPDGSRIYITSKYLNK